MSEQFPWLIFGGIGAALVTLFSSIWAAKRQAKGEAAKIKAEHETSLWATLENQLRENTKEVIDLRKLYFECERNSVSIMRDVAGVQLKVATLEATSSKKET